MLSLEADILINKLGICVAEADNLLVGNVAQSISTYLVVIATLLAGVMASVIEAEAIGITQVLTEFQPAMRVQYGLQ
jgi:hypothetical protein